MTSLSNIHWSHTSTPAITHTNVKSHTKTGLINHTCKPMNAIPSWPKSKFSISFWQRNILLCLYFACFQTSTKRHLSNIKLFNDVNLRQYPDKLNQHTIAINSCMFLFVVYLNCYTFRFAFYVLLVYMMIIKISSIVLTNFVILNKRKLSLFLSFSQHSLLGNLFLLINFCQINCFVGMCGVLVN